MRIAGAKSISLLHITSWDVDHCNPNELCDILCYLKPQRIQYPGYQPDSDGGRDSLKMINDYLYQNKFLLVSFLLNMSIHWMLVSLQSIQQLSIIQPKNMKSIMTCLLRLYSEKVVLQC